MMKLNKENIEEYLLLLVDNELGETEANEVITYVEQHPIYKHMLDTYLAACFDNTDIFIFPDKESLLKPEVVVMHMHKQKIKPMQLAAAIVLLLGMGVALTLMFRSHITSDKNNMLAAHESKSKNTIVPQPVIVGDSLLLAHVKVELKRKKSMMRPQQKKTKNLNTTGTVAIREKEQDLVPLANVSAKRMVSDVQVQGEMIASTHNEYMPSAGDAMLPQWIPLNAENLQGVNDLIAHIQILKENVQEKAQALKNTSFVIRLGDKEISFGK